MLELQLHLRQLVPGTTARHHSEDSKGGQKVQQNLKAFFPVLLLLVGFGLAGLFITLFAESAEEVMEQEFLFFDQLVIRLLQSAESPSLDTAMVIITELGSVPFLTTLSIITVIMLWVRFKDKWGILFFVLAIGGGGLLTSLLKRYYGRTRPSINEAIDAVGYSFPSGHSLGSLIFYGFIVYLMIRSRMRKTIKGIVIFILCLLPFLIGMSRIYLGAHFPSDVLAGYLAGLIWLILCLMALEWKQWQSKSHVKPVHAMRDFLKSIFGFIRRISR